MLIIQVFLDTISFDWQIVTTVREELHFARILHLGLLVLRIKAVSSSEHL